MIDYVIVIKNFLNPEGHQNPINGSKVTAIILKGWNLPISGASPGWVCACSLRCFLISSSYGNLWSFDEDFLSYFLMFQFIATGLALFQNC